MNTGVAPEVHPSGLMLTLVINDRELELLIHNTEVDAGRWGVNPYGEVESTELYERAVKRMRYLQEMKDVLKRTREAAAEMAAAA